MIGNQYQLSGLIVRINAACGIRQHHDVQIESLERANPVNHLLRGIAFVQMHAAGKRGDRHALERPDDQLARRGRSRSIAASPGYRS